MAAFLATLAAIFLLAETIAGYPTGEEPHRVEERSPTTGVEADTVLAGLTYTQNVLLSCYQPGLLPEIAAENKTVCEERSEISSNYKRLVGALGKVLRLHNLRERLGQVSNDSLEARALEVVIDSVLNQTCEWIELLGIRFNSSQEMITCNSSSGQDPMAQIKKLHTIISTYELVQEAQSSTREVVAGTDPTTSVNSRTWVGVSGVRPALDELLGDTAYRVHLSPRGCRLCSS